MCVKNGTAAGTKQRGAGTACEPFAVIDDLLRYLELDRRSAPHALADGPTFPFLVPKSFAGRMRKRDWHDPLLLQVLPRAEEAVERDGFSADTVGDAAAQAAPGLLHKYESRVLLLASPSCAMHCRFCFRRCGPVGSCTGGAAWRYIDGHPEVSEIILSGGDPLCLEPGAFADAMGRILSFPRVTTVRIHTRLPVADPAALTQAHIDEIAGVASVKNCVVVIHANHAHELAADSSRALSRLRATEAVVLNQSVLLRNINDRVEDLCALSRALLDHGILPYYLHQLDRVRGAWHFEVEEKQGRALITGMRERMPGYAVPRYVREVAGEKSKRTLL